MPATASISLLPRYTTFAGMEDFTTNSIAVARYDSFKLRVWRSGVEDETNMGVTFEIQESLDGEVWHPVTSITPGPAAETALDGDLTRALVRMKVSLWSTVSELPVVTCFAVGLLVGRTT